MVFRQVFYAKSYQSLCYKVFSLCKIKFSSKRYINCNYLALLVSALTIRNELGRLSQFDKKFQFVKSFKIFQNEIFIFEYELRCTKSDALNSIVPGFGTIVTFVCRLTWMRIDQKVETSPWTE